MTSPEERRNANATTRVSKKVTTIYFEKWNANGNLYII